MSDSQQETAKSGRDLLKNGRTPSDEFAFSLCFIGSTLKKSSERKEPSQNVYKEANPPLIRNPLDGSQTESWGVNATAYEADQDFIYVNFQYGWAANTPIPNLRV